jgi:hypothetical protein
LLRWQVRRGPSSGGHDLESKRRPLESGHVRPDLAEGLVSYVTISGGGTQTEFDSGHGSLSSKPSIAVSGTQMIEVGTSGGHSS